jgi:carbonic anhydrase
MAEQIRQALIDGYRRFYARYFLQEKGLFGRLSNQGQKPTTLIVACSDSRVDPAILLDADPGDLFVIRNVANLVPPYEPIGDSRHGTSAALEFGVQHLGVKHIIILGHSQCGGVRALLEPNCKENQSQFSFIADWVNIAADARKAAEALTGLTPDEKSQFCEEESIKLSLNNLMSFPWISEKVDAGQLTLHGWYFSLKDGSLSVWDASTQCFKAVPIHKTTQSRDHF